MPSLNPSDAWQPAPPSVVAWLDRPASVHGTGIDASGWEDSVWVLHAMYELPGGDTNTADEDRRQRLALGDPTALRSPFDGSPDADRVVNTGVPLGMTTAPPPPWRRLRWHELAARDDVSWGGKRHPPSHSWWKFKSWPLNIQPPCEGSLDAESAIALLAVLIPHSGLGAATSCVAHVGAHHSGYEHENGLFLPFELNVLPLHGDDEWAITPSNFWPDDRSWFVYTDWDLWATKVSGSHSLIADIERSTSLETVRFTASHGAP